MYNYIQPGDVIPLTAPATVLAGAGVLVGNLFGIAVSDALITETVQVKTHGVFQVAKVSAQAWATVGLLIYWDDSAKLFTTTAASNELVGVNTAVAANPSSTGYVRLNGSAH